MKILKKQKNEKIRWIILLLIFFLVINLLILFTFKGKLGGDESYEINKIIQLTFQGDIFSFRYYSEPYHYLLYLMQIPFTLPFYILFPANEFSSFLGSVFTSLIIMLFMFITVDKYFGKKSAILSCLVFILSPIGLKISFISEDATGNNLIIILFILFIYLFFNNNKKTKILSAILLAFLPLFSPYFLILVVFCVIYLLFKNFFDTRNRKLFFKDIGTFFIFFFLTLIILSPAYYFIFQSVKEGGHIPREEGIHDKVINKVKSFPIYFLYFKRSFVPFTDQRYFNISDELFIKTILNLSFFIYSILFIITLSYFTINNIMKKNIKNIFFLSLFPLFYIIFELFLTHRFVDIYERIISVSIHHIKLPIFVSFIAISVLASKNKKVRVIFYFFLLINLVSNIFLIQSIHYNNNLINYNLGNENRVGSLSERNTIKEEIFEKYGNNLTMETHNLLNKNKNITSSLRLGFNAREIDFLDDNIDYILYGFGIKLFYLGNDKNLASNLCNFLYEEDKIYQCKRGYLMSDSAFIKYLENY